MVQHHHDGPMGNSVVGSPNPPLGFKYEVGFVERTTKWRRLVWRLLPRALVSLHPHPHAHAHPHPNTTQIPTA